MYQNISSLFSPLSQDKCIILYYVIRNRRVCTFSAQAFLCAIVGLPTYKFSSRDAKGRSWATGPEPGQQKNANNKTDNKEA